MYCPKHNVKRDPYRRWHRPDRAFFANGACHILAYTFIERYAASGFSAHWIKPAAGFSGNHIFATNGLHAFDFHGLTTREKLLALFQRRAERFFPGWTATIINLPAGVLVSEARSREFEGLWLMQPDQFLQDPLARARSFLDRHTQALARVTSQTSCTSDAWE